MSAKKIQLNAALYEMCIFAITFARLSVVMLYYRTFSVSIRMTFDLKIIGVLSIMWCIQMSFCTILQCVPVEALFEPDGSLGMRCIDVHLGFVITETLDCALDIVLLCMPIPLVAKLRLPKGERMAIAVMLTLGGLYVVSSLTSFIC
jgi:hypothetical protein